AVFRSQFKRVVEFRFEGQWMRLVAWRCETGGSETERYNTWRVRAAALVTMRKRSIDQGLIRKVELGRPIHDGTPGDLLPFLIDFALLQKALPRHKRPAWKEGEILCVIGEAQSAGQLHIRRYLIIGFAESGPRLEAVGIVAQEIIVAL